MSLRPVPVRSWLSCLSALLLELPVLLVLVVLIPGPAAAGETEAEPKRPLLPVSFDDLELIANGGGFLPAVTAEGQRGWLEGGVTLRVEGMRIHSERIDVLMDRLAGGRVFINTAALTPIAGERLLIDTRETTVETLNVRVLLQPTGLTVRRVDEASRIRLFIDAADLGAFSGQFRDSDGAWRDFDGRSQALEAEAEAVVLPAGLGDLRLVRLSLLGGESTAELHLPSDDQDLTWLSRRLDLSFAADGSLSGIASGRDTVLRGRSRSPVTLPGQRPARSR